MTVPRRMSTDAAFWNNLAESYASKPVENMAAFERKIEVTKGQIRPDDVILEVGCGTGTLALILAPHAAEVHGLDFSAEMIRIAKDKATKQGVGNVCFHVGAFDRSLTTFDDTPLDGVLAYSLLHLVESPREALEQMHGLLRPGGYFIASTVCLGEGRMPWGPILTVMRWLGKAPRVKILSKTQLVSMLREVGFVDIREPDVGADKATSFVVASKAPAK